MTTSTRTTSSISSFTRFCLLLLISVLGLLRFATATGNGTHTNTLSDSTSITSTETISKSASESLAESVSHTPTPTNDVLSASQYIEMTEIANGTSNTSEPSNMTNTTTGAPTTTAEPNTTTAAPTTTPAPTRRFGNETVYLMNHVSNEGYAVLGAFLGGIAAIALFGLAMFFVTKQQSATPAADEHARIVDIRPSTSAAAGAGGRGGDGGPLSPDVVDPAAAQQRPPRRQNSAIGETNDGTGTYGMLGSRREDSTRLNPNRVPSVSQEAAPRPQNGGPNSPENTPARFHPSTPIRQPPGARVAEESGNVPSEHQPIRTSVSGTVSSPPAGPRGDTGGARSQQRLLSADPEDTEWNTVRPARRTAPNTSYRSNTDYGDADEYLSGSTGAPPPPPPAFPPPSDQSNPSGQGSGGDTRFMRSRN